MPARTSAPSLLVRPETSAEPRRRKLWQVSGGLHCSVLGTCLSHEDLQRIARKRGLHIQPHARTYDVHAHFVSEAGKDSPVSRALNKLLEQRYEGIVRKVGRCTNDKVLESLWQAEYEAGRVAGAYWAFLTHTHIPAAQQTRAFGEVHMLSHALGRATHQSALQASELAQRAQGLEDKLMRQARNHADALAHRDAEITRLSQGRANAAPGESPAAHRPERRERGRSDRLFLQRERALVSARERARAAETRVGALDLKVRNLERTLRALRSEANQNACPGADACDQAIAAEQCRVLYIGGRSGAVDELRGIAARANAEFIHHDGGLEQAVARIDGLIEGCDAVFCPIDCVSHSACLRAKALCRKHNKRFVPLRSAGRSAFERALAATLVQ